VSSQDALLAIAKGRAVVRAKTPYFMSTLLALTFYESTEVPTIGVTASLTCLYNPNWVKKLSAEKMGGVLVHEIMHILHRHCTRMGVGMDHKRWNIAGDLAINPSVLQAGFELPEDGQFPEKYGFPVGETTDQYYVRLEKRAKEHPEDGHGEGVCSGSCGSVAGGKDAAGAEKADQTHGRSKLEVASVVKKLREAVRERARSHGTMWGMSADEIEADDSKVSWRQLLRNKIQTQMGRITAGATDYSLKRPSRRSYVDGYPRPSLITRTPELAIAADTSGSVSATMLAEAMGEAIAILRATGAPDAWFLECDSQIATKPRRVNVPALRKIVLHGRGGTAFDPVLQAVEHLRPRPQLLVYLTDGEGHATYRPKDVPVVWGVIGDSLEWLQRDGWTDIVQIK
jgi:predicted metal-dependent peptidase